MAAELQSLETLTCRPLLDAEGGVAQPPEPAALQGGQMDVIRVLRSLLNLAPFAVKPFVVEGGAYPYDAVDKSGASMDFACSATDAAGGVFNVVPGAHLGRGLVEACFHRCWCC